MDARPTRPCILCGKYDTGPRDQGWLPDGNTVYYHMDCHAMVGCKTCEAVLETAGGVGNHLKDDALVDHLTNPEVLASHEIFTTDDASGAYEAAVARGEMHPRGTVIKGVAIPPGEEA